jgi:cephalosporin hydroxylase
MMTTEVRIQLLQLQEEIEELIAWLRPQQPTRILEIGAHQGGTAFHWCSLASGLVVSVDLPNGNGGGLPLEQCLERNTMIRNAYPQYVGVLGDSHDPKTLQVVTDLMEGTPFDFLFIDGDHSYAGVKRDFEMYSPLVKPGSWVGFHDINDTEIHRGFGCQVEQFWTELHGTKQEFNSHGPWGGIGVIQV